MKDTLMNVPQEYLDDILVRLAYNFAGIEGRTILLPATISIIINGTICGDCIIHFFEGNQLEESTCA